MKPLILAFTTSYLPFVGGAEIALLEISKRLGEDFDFRILTARSNRQVGIEERMEGARILRLGLGSPLDKWLMPFSVLTRWLRQGRGMGRKGRTVILWGMDITQGTLSASLLKRLASDVPFVLTIQYGGGHGRLAHGRVGLIGLSFRFMLSQADYVIPISNYLSAIALAHGYKGPMGIIPNGVDIPKFKRIGERSRGQPPTLITTSRLVYKNGIDTLLKAVAVLKNEIPQLRCQVLGDGPLKGELERLAAELELQDNVSFLGNVSPGDVPSYLWQADVFARPSRSEGMGNSFLEALAAGIPIVGTEVGGIPDIIRDGETGLLARVDDPKDVADKCKALLIDKGLSDKIVRNGIWMVQERFSWESIAETYRDVFSQLIPT